MTDFDDPDQYVLRYAPRRVSARVWEVIGSDVRAAVSVSAESVESAKTMCSHVAAFAAWAHREGAGTAAATLGDPEVVERYIQVGMPGCADGTRATRRTVLRRVAARLVPPVVPEPARMGYRQIRPPYQPWQISRYFELARQQPTLARRRCTLTVLSLGLGCGFDGRDVAWVRASDVVSHAGHVEVRVTGGQRPRSVVALADYGDVITQCADDAGEELLIGRSTPGQRNVTSVALARLFTDRSLPTLVTSRLRSTWLLSHLNLGTPLPVVLAAAGVHTCRPLEDLLSYAAPIDAARAASLLTGA